MKMEGIDLLVSLVENMVKIVTEVLKNLKSKQVKRHRYKPRLCYVCRRKGHLAHDCPDQMKHKQSERGIVISENRRVNADESNKRKKKKNHMYLVDKIEDIRLIRFGNNDKYVKSV